ncbi:MAG: heavy metal translocating P-type ATPase [Pseudolysinimonas sp.]|uniref:heavy metal translocating P-type ATPase n=1 Tax=Pseudolysinimonas sp. TaxID=2680009 RepID=UPI003C74D5E4
MTIRAATRILARYPLVILVLVGGLLAGVFAFAGVEPAARWTATAVAAVVALAQVVNMVRDARAGRWGLDVLAVLAIGSTAVLGDYWTSLIVALMMAGGEALEDYASHRARGQLSALLSRVPRRARRIGSDGEPHAVDVAEVSPGDVLVVTPGEVVPVDAELLDGEADFDESSLTGESLPVTHPAGSPILSGSVNGSTTVRMRASARAADSQYQQIVALVEGAAASRGRFVRLADRYALPFTALALLIAGLAWAISGDPTRFAQVLVVATPCPLLIAAPVAFVAGMGRAAREGVVIKSGESLERLARPRTVAIDKTGTLTRGRPEVDRVEAFGTSSADEILALAAGMEAGSNHVLATAIVDAAAQRALSPEDVTDLEELTAHGMRGRWNGSALCLGKAAFVAAETGPFELGELAPGETAVYVGVAGEPVGRIVLRDEVRADAAATIALLRAGGVGAVVMLTGDADATARHVARAVGIIDVRSGLLPADKVAVVSALPDRPVLVVGDGVNDAPVLAAADVGVAMGARGSTAASESADVVILLDDISRVGTAVATARRTVRIAGQSIAIGIGLSIVFMLIAATGVLPAIAGALVQEGIDVATILNGLRAGRGSRSRAVDETRKPLVNPGVS